MTPGINEKITSTAKRNFGRRIYRGSLAVFLVALSALFLCQATFGQSQFENKTLSAVDISFDSVERSEAEAEEFRSIARNAVGSTYSTVRIRDTIEKLYGTGRIAAVTVSASNDASGGVILDFRLTRKTQASRVVIEIIGEDNDVKEADILNRLNLLEPGKAISESTLNNNATRILEYLRDRGYFRAEVAFEQRPLQSPTDVLVTFKVTPNAQATVKAFELTIPDFDTRKALDAIKLKPGEGFSRDKLTADVDRIRKELREEGFLAPRLEEPRVVYDSELNTIEISMDGLKGPTVEVVVDAENDKPGEGTQTRLLPIKREGTLDYAAIIEGERRLENHFQEIGYFFVNVRSVCSVEPELKESEASATRNDTASLCAALSSADLADKKVTVKYEVDLNRKLKLVDIRLQGTDQFTIEEIKTVLDSQTANILGFIPIFGYGRGYTSEAILQEDSATIRSLLRQLGYREATVRVNQGVSIDGENLIITFIVDQGEPTIVSGVEIEGNKQFSDDELLGQIPNLVGSHFSRTRVTLAQRKLAEFYSKQGFYDANVRFSIDERVDNPDADDYFKIKFTIENEGQKVYVGRILVTGNEDTKTQAIEKAVALRPGELLRSADVYTSEQNLYGTDVFARVDVKPQPPMTLPNGTSARDIIVDVEEQAPRILTYGGGFSTDYGPNGFVDIRHLNLFGNLWQAGARVRVSQRQQLVQLDFVNPRFISDGEKRFAPLALTATYQRDSTVTRFFRSEFDKGTHGIVQRVDEEGNPIDEFGNAKGDPTLHRLTLTAETNKTLSRKDRSVIFVKYRYEDVRLYNVDSLLIKDLLIPDKNIRISGFGATFVRDTRRRCGIEYTILDIIARGEPGEPCRYNASDPTEGSYLTFEYNVSLPWLGANIGFHKFQASYNYYKTFNFLNKTTFAARAILGGANVFSEGNRFDPVQFPGFDGLLPISERFFAGGANTLRGFDFESAGPRYVVVPSGIFRDSNGEPVYLEPFSIPFGGNALAVVNLEARIPVTKSVRVVPFYDGGNVFAKFKDIFNPADAPPNNTNLQNLRVLWTHSVGLGLRLKTPIGGEFGIDYGYLLNPPRFQIPQPSGPNAIYQLPQGRLHFRFSQAF